MVARRPGRTQTATPSVTVELEERVSERGESFRVPNEMLASRDHLRSPRAYSCDTGV